MSTHSQLDSEALIMAAARERIEACPEDIAEIVGGHYARLAATASHLAVLFRPSYRDLPSGDEARVVLLDQIETDFRHTFGIDPIWKWKELFRSYPAARPLGRKERLNL